MLKVPVLLLLAVILEDRSATQPAVPADLPIVGRLRIEFEFDALAEPPFYAGLLALDTQGDRLWIHGGQDVVNLADVATLAWRRCGPWLALLVACGVIWRIWRIQRKPQIAGAPYCRRCNYCLRGIEGDVCPECGSPQRKPRRGRTRWRRTVPMLATLAAVGLAYVATQRFSNWLYWSPEWTASSTLPQHTGC